MSQPPTTTRNVGADVEPAFAGIARSNRDRQHPHCRCNQLLETAWKPAIIGVYDLYAIGATPRTTSNVRLFPLYEPDSASDKRYSRVRCLHTTRGTLHCWVATRSHWLRQTKVWGSESPPEAIFKGTGSARYKPATPGTETNVRQIGQVHRAELEYLFNISREFQIRSAICWGSTPQMIGGVELECRSVVGPVNALTGHSRQTQGCVPDLTICRHMAAI